MSYNTRPVGPEMEGCDGGLYQEVEILDNLEHLNPWKRPPKRVIVQLKQAINLERDRSLDRPKIKQDGPGKPIKDLYNKHSGRVALLFNGNSLAEHDLGKIDCPIIGMNRTIEGYPTYHGPKTDYYVFIDQPWIKYAKEHAGVINVCRTNQPIGYRVTKSWRMRPFSFDLWWDGVVPVETGYVALQAAVYLGFTELYCLGLDLQGEHFDNTSSGTGMQKSPEFQSLALPLLKEHDINVFRCGTKDSLSPFPFKPFDEVFSG